MADDALKAFGNYEKQKQGLAISTQCAVGTVNGKPALSVVIVVVYPPEKIRTAVADALDQTITFLT